MHKISGLEACDAQYSNIDTKRIGATIDAKGLASTGGNTVLFFRISSKRQCQPSLSRANRKIRHCYPRGNTWRKMADLGWN